MSDKRTIYQSEIDSFSRLVNLLSDEAHVIRGSVATVDRKASALEKEIDTAKAEFRAFRSYDEQQKELARAKTQIVNVRQQVQEKFGTNDMVRQYLTGILQASDVSLVRQNIISNCTEKLMLSCPEYWLAPCLVAISAWLNDDRPLAERALHEALKRDDEKTSLLFALVCRRVGRMKASAAWLERYLAVQDPKAMERKMVTVLDAYSNGLFGPQSRAICAEKIGQWIQELSQEVGFVEEQQKSWEESMLSKVDGHSADQRYPYSAKRATNWKKCTASLNEMALHGKLLDYFKGIFEKKQGSNVSLNARLDELLENYVSSYDNAELPLRREERMMELLIEERGRKDRAEMRFQEEQKSLEEDFDFTQLLTNAAMHADVIKASNATQRLAIALSKPWVISAYNNVILKIRQHVPAKLLFEIEGWKGEMSDGSEEEKLCAAADDHFTEKRDLEISGVVQSKWDMVIPIACGVAALAAFITGSSTWGIIGLLAAGGFGLRWFLNKKKCEKTRQQITDHYAELMVQVKDTLRALCAERVDYIDELCRLDAVSDKTCEYLEGIQVGQYVATSGQRSIG